MPHNLTKEFPIRSQSSDSDKLCLLGIRELLGDTVETYRYLEIGSYLGGSLAPFVADPRCLSIFSIDDRGCVQPDSRGINVDYRGISHQTMLDGLAEVGLTTDKIKTFDGSVNDAKTDVKFDFAFIDGEHTDEACFRDFIWTLPMMKPDSIVAFHDSTLIYKALKLIQIYVDHSGKPCRFIKRNGSEMSVMLFGSFQKVDVPRYIGEPENLTNFYVNADATLLRQQISYRMRIRFAPARLLDLRVPARVEIIPPPVKSAAAY